MGFAFPLIRCVLNFLKADVKENDKASAIRSKHSVTEQRRRSKINERFVWFSCYKSLKLLERWSSDLVSSRFRSKRKLLSLMLKLFEYLGLCSVFGNFAINKCMGLRCIYHICFVFLMSDCWIYESLVRFQILREIIPNSEQKRDTASFLLEVIFLWYFEANILSFRSMFFSIPCIPF